MCKKDYNKTIQNEILILQLYKLTIQLVLSHAVVLVTRVLFVVVGASFSHNTSTHTKETMSCICQHENYLLYVGIGCFGDLVTLFDDSFHYHENV